MAINVLSNRLSVASDATGLSHVAINAAFLQEIKDIHVELWGSLQEIRSMCRAVDQATHWQFRLVMAFEELRDLFAMHFALEEGFGYFENPAFIDLDISRRANELRSDHKALYCEICEICEWIDEARFQGRLSAKLSSVSLRFESFLDQFRIHESREQELIYDSFCNDLGTGD